MNFKKNYKFGIVMLLVVILMGGCSTTADVTTNDLSYEGGLKIVGNNIDEVIPYNDIYKMESNVVKMEATTSEGEVVEKEVKGVNFFNVIDELGINLDSVKSLRLVAGDGYEINISKEEFEGTEFILAYEFDGEQLDEKTMPLRSAINGVRTMYWVSNLTEIDINFSDNVAIEEVSNLESTYYILEESTKTLEKEDYTYYESVDKAIKVKDLFEKYVNNTSETVKFIAVDGFEKTEDLDILLDGYIKLTGENAPLFISPDMPKGMQVKNILTLECGDSVFLSGKLAQDKFTEGKAKDDVGADLEEIITFFNIDFETIEFIASDGYSVEVEKKSMNEGILNLMDDTTYKVEFSENFSKGTTIKEVLKFNAGSGEKIIKSTEIEEISESDSIWTVEISGLSDGVFNLDSEKAMKKFEKVEFEATKVKKDGSEITEEWAGYKVNDILSFLKVEDMNSVVFVASDGYEVELTKEMIDDETIVAISVGGESLDSDTKIQLVVKNQPGNTWVKSLAKIIVK
jgi:hypothetical protein